MCNFGTMYPFCLNEFYVLGYIECIVKISLTLINNFSAFVSANGWIGICPPFFFMELRVRGDNI